MKRESTFQRELIDKAPLFKCYAMEIPDPIITKDRRQTRLIEHRRPFDVVLVTKTKVFCLELKINYNTQLDHQKETENRIHRINEGVYYVIKKIFDKNLNAKYRIEQRQQILLTVDSLIDVFEYFVSFGS